MVKGEIRLEWWWERRWHGNINLLIGSAVQCSAVQGGDAMKALFKMFFHLYIYNTGL